MVISLRRYATISVPAEVKEILEKAKGSEEWGDFLLMLFYEVKRLRGEQAFRELAESLSEDELNSIATSSKEFRERFFLR